MNLSEYNVLVREKHRFQNSCWTGKTCLWCRIGSSVPITEQMRSVKERKTLRTLAVTEQNKGNIRVFAKCCCEFVFS